MSMLKSKKGIAFSIVVIAAIGIVVLVVAILIFSGQMSVQDDRLSDLYDRDCLSIPEADCVSEENCETPARRIFDDSLIECPEYPKRLKLARGSSGSTNLICCLKVKES